MNTLDSEAGLHLEAEKAYTTLQIEINEFNEQVDDLHKQLERAREAFTGYLLGQMEKADPARAAHSRRVSHYAVDTAKELGLSEAERENIGLAALLHDFGALNAPAAILQKQDELTTEERRTLRFYICKGAEVLSQVQTFEDIAKLMSNHYEWYAGEGGYPGKLHGEEIPIGARIIAIANAYDAMITRRPGRKPISSQDALMEISARTGTQYDPDVVEAFVRVV